MIQLSELTDEAGTLTTFTCTGCDVITKFDLQQCKTHGAYGRRCFAWMLEHAGCKADPST